MLHSLEALLPELDTTLVLPAPSTGFGMRMTHRKWIHFGAQGAYISALLCACYAIVEVANTDKWKSNHSLIPYIAPVMMVI